MFCNFCMNKFDWCHCCCYCCWWWWLCVKNDNFDKFKSCCCCFCVCFDWDVGLLWEKTAEVTYVFVCLFYSLWLALDGVIFISIIKMAFRCDGSVEVMVVGCIKDGRHRFLLKLLLAKLPLRISQPAESLYLSITALGDAEWLAWYGWLWVARFIRSLVSSDGDFFFFPFYF